MAKTSKKPLVLWGKHPAHGNVPIKLEYYSSQAAMERRRREGWTVAVYAEGDEPTGLSLSGAKKKTTSGPGLNEFVKGYLEAAVWSSTGEDGEPLDRDHSADDFSKGSVEKAVEDSASFIDANRELLDSTGGSWSQHGHDFWLTRNGHGAGFWDRGYGAAGDALTKAAHGFGEATVYVGDNGKLEIS